MTTAPHATSILSGVVRRVFSIDYRILGIFRIALGSILLLDLFQRAPFIAEYYSERGILPREVLRSIATDTYWSVNFLSGDLWFQNLLFGIALITNLAFLLGWRTRLATLLLWVLLASRQIANPFVNSAADGVLRLLLFWSMLLPLGAAYSIDNPSPRRGTLLSFASAGILIQLVLVYVASALFKSHPVWTLQGTAISLALQLDAFVTPFGRELLAFPGLLKPLTFATMYLELFVPLFAFSPVFTREIRIFLVFSFWLFHLILSFIFELGLFPATCMAGWLLFLALPESEPQCLPEPTFRSRVQHRAENLLGFLALSIVLFMNGWLTGIIKTPLPRQYWEAANVLQLWQRWQMFAPFPAVTDGAFVAVGTLESGRRVNLFTEGGPLNVGASLDSSPEFQPHTVYKNSHWKKFFVDIYEEKNLYRRQAYADYLCRNWDHKKEKLNQVELFYVFEFSSLDQKEGAPAPVKLFQKDCD